MSSRVLFLCAAIGLLTADLPNARFASAGQKPKEWAANIQPSEFVGAVTNPYFPLPSGRTLRYRGETKNGVETLQIEVTYGTKLILGVTTTVVVETHALDGQVEEISENWFAQDRDGNVWYFGEFSQTYENGSPINSAGSWEAGVGDAQPGIMMQAQPRVGDTYFQEFAPGVAQDMAQVLSTMRSVTVPHGSFSQVLLTKEWTALESNSVEHKSYAPGIGLILEEKGSERVQLVEVH